jgi:predicted RNase H-like HicB family nuclease
MKKNDKKQFPVVIEQDEDGVYIAECPVFKGCYTQGDTIDEAMKNIREVIEMCLEEEKCKNEIDCYKPINFSFASITI